MPRRQQPVFKYKYTADEDPSMSRSYKCRLQCYQCAAKTGKGAQCTRKVCVGLPYCAQHMRSIMSLEIRPSDIQGAGLGVFAIRRAAKAPRLVFRGGDEITEYFGECLSTQELEDRYGEDDHGLGVYAHEAGSGYDIDSACIRSVASMINSHPHDWNCKAVAANRYQTNGCTRLTIVASKDIMDGDELLLNYGAGYFANTTQQVKYSTSNVPRISRRKRRTIRSPVQRGERKPRREPNPDEPPKKRKTRHRYTRQERQERQEQKELKARQHQERKELNARKRQEREEQRANRPPKERKARQRKPRQEPYGHSGLDLPPIQLPAQTPGLKHYGMRSQQPYNLRPSTAEQLGAKPTRRRRRRQTAESKRAKPARQTQRKRAPSTKPRRQRPAPVALASPRLNALAQLRRIPRMSDIR